MIDAILLLSVSASIIVSVLLLISLRRLKRAIDKTGDAIASNYACLDYLKEEAEGSHQALQHLINRNEYHIAINKFNLSNTRLQLLMHQQYAVQNEDYENAGAFAQAISQIEELLNEE